MSLLPSAEQICTHCGACCATFRVSFYWAEGSALPPDYTVALTPRLRLHGGYQPKPAQLHCLTRRSGPRGQLQRVCRPQQHMQGSTIGRHTVPKSALGTPIAAHCVS